MQASGASDRSVSAATGRRTQGSVDQSALAHSEGVSAGLEHAPRHGHVRRDVGAYLQACRRSLDGYDRPITYGAGRIVGAELARRLRGTHWIVLLALTECRLWGPPGE